MSSRSYPSGATKRKKQKEREEDAKRNAGALLKFLNPQQSHSAFTESSQLEAGHTSGELIAELGAGAKVTEMKTESCPSSNLTMVSSENVTDAQLETPNQELVPVSFGPAATTAVKVEGQSNTAINHPQDVAEERAVGPSEMKECHLRSDLTLTDISLWPSVIPDELRVYIVQKGVEIVQHSNDSFINSIRYRKGEKIKGSERRLTKDFFYKAMPNGEKVRRSWMCYSPTEGSIACFCCKLFSASREQDSGGFSSKTGFSKWWKPERVRFHEISKAHVECFSKWQELAFRLRHEKTIDNQAEAAVEKEKTKWRDVLKRILDIIRFLAKQNMSLRGHREDNLSENQGNFLELVNLMAKYDEKLAKLVAKRKQGINQTTYLSAAIQNEFVHLMGNRVRKDILDQVKEAKYFAIFFDSTTDSAHIDQTSQVLRYVEFEEDSVVVRESFIDFIETKGKHANEITEMILEKLKADELDIMNCRGQGYDNAAVMKGKHTGVQKQISDINPKAKFIACSNHSLNLAGVHAAKTEVHSITFFGILERLYAFFSASSHRWDLLHSTTGVVIKRISETRWSARGDAVKVVKIHFSEIVDVLERLTGPEENDNTRSDATLLLPPLQTFSFLSFLGLWSSVLTELNDTQNYLQIKGLSIGHCAQKLDALKLFLETKRDEIINTAISFAESTCTEMGITPEPPRRVRRKKRVLGDGETAEDAGLTYKQEIRRQMLACLDKLIVEIKTRFEQLRSIADSFSFLAPATLLDPLTQVNLDYAPDDIDKEEFCTERDRLQRFVSVSPNCDSLKQQGPLQLLNYLHRHRLSESVPNIVIMLRIYLTMGVSVATCERSFSKLKLIKNYLRSTMIHDRLTNLAILSIEREVADRIDFDSVITDFAEKKARKVDVSL